MTTKTESCNPTPPAEPTPRPEIETLFSLHRWDRWRANHLREMAEQVAAVTDPDALTEEFTYRLTVGRRPKPVTVDWEKVRTSKRRTTADAWQMPVDLRAKYTGFGTYQLDEITFTVPFDGDPETLMIRLPVLPEFGTHAAVDRERKTLTAVLDDWYEDAAAAAWGTWASTVRWELERLGRELNNWNTVVAQEAETMVNNRRHVLRAAREAQRIEEARYR